MKNYFIGMLITALGIIVIILIFGDFESKNKSECLKGMYLSNPIEPDVYEYLEVGAPGASFSEENYYFLGEVVKWSNDTTVVKVNSSNQQVSIFINVISTSEIPKSSKVILKAEPWAGGYEAGWCYTINVVSKTVQN